MMFGSKLIFLLLLERLFVPREGNYLTTATCPRVRFLSPSEVVLLYWKLGSLHLSRCHHANLVHARDATSARQIDERDDHQARRGRAEWADQQGATRTKWSRKTTWEVAAALLLFKN